MKILMICEFFVDALDYQENMLARSYHRMGHKVTVIASTIRSLKDYVNDGDRGQGRRSIEYCEWGRLIRVPFCVNILHRIKRFESLTPLIEEIGPDLLFFHDIIPNLDQGARYVRANPNCAMIMDYHADASNSGANWLSKHVLHAVVRKWMLDRARPYLRKILPVTPGSIDFLRDLYGVQDAEMELLPLGTDQQYSARVLGGDARQRIRNDLGIAPNSLVIFTGGKFHPYKKTEDVLNAVAGIDDSLDVHVILVGTSDPAYQNYAASIMKIAEHMPRVHMVGWQDRAGVYEHMAASDVAIFPASQSVLWQQSIGMGLPLIVSERSAGLRGVQKVDYLNRHGNLIVLDPERPFPEQIADQIRQLASDRNMLAKMSRGATQTATEILDYDAIAERTLEFALNGSWE